MLTKNIKAEKNLEFTKVMDCPYFETSCPNQNSEELIHTCICPKFKAYLAIQNEENIKTQLGKMNVDTTLPLFSQMMEIQKYLATKFHKIKGLTKEEKDLWINRYLTCIEDEAGEAREYLKYGSEKMVKEWNDKEFNKELIDILHFLLDMIIVGEISYEELTQTYMELYSNNEIDDLLIYSLKNQKPTAKMDSIYLEYLTDLLDANRQIRGCISWKHWKKANDTIDKKKLCKAVAYSYFALINMFVLQNLTAEELYDIYVKKNIENIFRQEFGYLTGK